MCTARTFLTVYCCCVFRHQLNVSFLQGQIFEGLEDEDFSFGNDTFMPRKNVKKLTLKKSLGRDSGTPSRASSLSGEPANLTSFREEEVQQRGR